jgi:hypothetical protein
VIWFNHANEKGYAGQKFEPMDGVIVVGGGLASIDVAKVLMLETTRRRLAERGIEIPMVQLEVKGIPKLLEAQGLRFEELGLEGCTIYYRRRAEDMPLVEIPEGATPERAAKTLGARRKLLEKAMEKYRFKLEPLCMPESLLVENERLVGLRFRRTRAEGGKIVPTDESFERRAPYVISSIGSIPAPLDGIPMKGELFAFVDWELGRLADEPKVFSAGNVATGKGNIIASRKHAASVANAMLAGHLREQPPLAAGELAKLRARVRERQTAVGYPGDYAAWIEKATPPDLE